MAGVLNRLLSGILVGVSDLSLLHLVVDSGVLVHLGWRRGGQGHCILVVLDRSHAVDHRSLLHGVVLDRSLLHGVILDRSLLLNDRSLLLDALGNNILLILLLERLHLRLHLGIIKHG
jgi:hypothetical protein